MTHRAMSLMDVLAPPGNYWLMELSHRKTDLPPGVHVVRFSAVDDELVEDAESAGPKTRQRKKLPA